ncbi:MAG: efflux RND transporter permease subunit [Opitutaceae bacterium]|nr:efflux RND transporter permease subunit [Opitutaceae bacterium]
MDTPAPAPAAAPRRAARSTYAFTTRRPVAILMAVMAVCVFGWVSYKRLALTLMPDISYPTLTVRTEYPGTAPEEIENLISRPLEQELGVVPRLVRINSISKAGQSDVILEFAWDADMNSVAQDIREKVDRVRLPDGAERPLLLRYDPSLDPILRFGLHGPQSLYELRYLADHEIKRTLEALDGVAAVKVKGGLEEEYQVRVDEHKLALLGLDIATLNTRLAQGNVNLPGGNLHEGQTQYLVRTMNEFRTLEEIGELIIARQPTGVDVRLRDVAEVTASHKELEVMTRVNGRESIEIEIYKEAGANVVEVARRVRNTIYGLEEQRQFVAEMKAAKARAETAKPAPAAATEAKGDKKKDGAPSREQRMAEAQQRAREAQMTDYIEYRLPEGSAIDLLTDQSVFIQKSIDEVKSNAIVGGLIAIAVLYLFLRNVLHTLIIGVTIPVSIVATFAPMYMWDVSLNIISLGGLALGVGMLVDNSIVVLESIFRCREEGDDLLTAVVRGTGEVGGAVVASTLTTVAVFFPIVFVEGVAGQIFGDMALTVVFSLMASLVVALFVIPMLASRRTDTFRAMGASGGAYLNFPESPATAGLGRRALDTLHTLALVGMRYGLAAAASLYVPLMAAVAVAAVALWPLYGPVERWIVRPKCTLLARLARWMAGAPDDFWSRQVWPGMVGVTALGHFRDSMLGFSRRIASARVWGRLWRIALLPVVLLAFVFRLLFACFLRMAGTCLFLQLMALALLVLGAVRIGAMLLHPVVQPGLAITGRLIDWLQHLNVRALDWCIARGWSVAFASVAAFAFVMVVGAPRLGSELIPQVHQGEFNLDVTMPVGTPLERTAEVVTQIERLALAEPEVERAATRVGTDEGATSSADEGEHTGQVTIRLKPGSTPQTEETLIARIRAGVRDLPEIKMEVSYPSLFTFKAPIEVEVRGYDLTTLRRLSREVETRLRDIPGLADVRSTLQAGNPELQVVYDRDRLAEFGLTLRNVADLVRNKVQGHVATDFRQRERQIDVLVRLQEEDRLGLDELRNLVVNPGGAVPIPLEAVARISIAEGPSEIRRVDQQRTALITANVAGLDLGTASLLIHDAIREIDFPSGFHCLVAGQNEEMQTSLNSMMLALGLALFLVYIVMASQFESLLHPLIIMFTVPLALIGVVLVLWVAKIPLSIIVFIGLIMLAGIVVNNAIVLIDFINTLRASGVELHEAVRQAGTARLRPILMTTLTTVLGLLPMALGLGEGAEIRAPMAITVIVGLTSSTVLTLVVIPTIYVLVERRRGAVATATAKAPAGTAPAATPPPAGEPAPSA